MKKIWIVVIIVLLVILGLVLLSISFKFKGSLKIKGRGVYNDQFYIDTYYPLIYDWDFVKKTLKPFLESNISLEEVNKLSDFIDKCVSNRFVEDSGPDTYLKYLDENNETTKQFKKLIIICGLISIEKKDVYNVKINELLNILKNYICCFEYDRSRVEKATQILKGSKDADEIKKFYASGYINNALKAIEEVEETIPKKVRQYIPAIAAARNILQNTVNISVSKNIEKIENDNDNWFFTHETLSKYENTIPKKYTQLQLINLSQFAPILRFGYETIGFEFENNDPKVLDDLKIRNKHKHDDDAINCKDIIIKQYPLQDLQELEKINPILSILNFGLERFWYRDDNNNVRDVIRQLNIRNIINNSIDDIYPARLQLAVVFSIFYDMLKEDKVNEIFNHMHNISTTFVNGEGNLSNYGVFWDCLQKKLRNLDKDFEEAFHKVREVRYSVWFLNMLINNASDNLLNISASSTFVKIKA